MSRQRVRQHEVTFPSEDRVIAGTLIQPDRTSGSAVLFVHGLGSSSATNVERATEVAARHGATCLAIDLGGHGRSSGRLSKVTPRQNLADVVAGFDRLAQVPGIDQSQLGICAASYGAYLSVLLTAWRPVNRMLLRAPALYTDDSFDRTLGRRRLGDPTSAPTPLAHLRIFPGPVMIVESEYDEVISHDIITAYLAALPTAAHVIQRGARHALTDPGRRADFQGIVVEFFGTVTDSSPGGAP